MGSRGEESQFFSHVIAFLKFIDWSYFTHDWSIAVTCMYENKVKLYHFNRQIVSSILNRLNPDDSGLMKQFVG